MGGMDRKIARQTWKRLYKGKMSFKVYMLSRGGQGLKNMEAIKRQLEREGRGGRLVSVGGKPVEEIAQRDALAAEAGAGVGSYDLGPGREASSAETTVIDPDGES